MEPWLHVASSFAGSAQIFVHLIMVINAIRGGLRRFVGYFVTYRWELALLFGIPFVSTQAVWLSTLGIGSLLSAIEYDEADGVITIILGGGRLAGGIAGLLFLSLLYRRVKALDRVFLRSLWGYSIAVQAITAVGEIVDVVFVVVHPLESFMLVSLRMTGVALIELLATFVVFLWYARQLSRVSLMHAFFLVAFTTLAMAGPIQGASRSPGVSALIVPTPTFFILAYYLLPVLVWFADEAIKAWFVGNFEWRGERFRKKATIIVTGLVILSPYLWAGYWTLMGLAAGPYYLTHPMVGPLVGFGIILAVQVGMIAFLFGSVYLVRVRQPKTEIVESHA